MHLVIWVCSLYFGTWVFSHFLSLKPQIGNGVFEINGENNDSFQFPKPILQTPAFYPFVISTFPISVLIHLMLQSPLMILLQFQQEVSPRTSGRLSHSSGPLNGAQSCGSLTDSPPVSPSEIDDLKVSFPVTGDLLNIRVFRF